MPRDMADIFEAGFLIPGLSLTDAILNHPGVRARGFVPAVGSFLPDTGPSVAQTGEISGAPVSAPVRQPFVFPRSN